MEEKIIKKVTRLLELSKKFTRTSEEVIPFNTRGNANINACVESFTWQLMQTSNRIEFQLEGRELYIGENGVVMAKDNKPLTRADSICAEAEVKAKLIEEHIELLQLQNELSEYFNSLSKVIA